MSPAPTSVAFLDGDVVLVGRVHAPSEPDPALPVVVVTGSWLTVKEQMPDLYAARLAEQGCTALTFDFAGFGASGGSLRQTEVPTRKMTNLAAAVAFARGLGSQDPAQGPAPALLAVCASAQYALAALSAGLEVSGFVAVAGWFHDPATVAPLYGGAGGVADRLARASSAVDQLTVTGSAPTVPAYEEGSERAGMSVAMDYYANPQRGAVSAWRNEMSEITWQHWLTFDGLAAADQVEVPTLLVHSDEAVLPDNVKRVAAALAGPVEVVWTEGEQTDFYDRPEQVTTAIDAAVAHLGTIA